MTHGPTPTYTNSWSDFAQERERIARLETSSMFLTKQLEAQHDRLNKTADRIMSVERRSLMNEEHLRVVPTMHERMDRIERRAQSFRETVQWTAAAAILGAVLSGAVSGEAVVHLLKSILLPG